MDANLEAENRIEESSPEPVATQREISGFWARPLALLIDFLVLGIPASLLGIFLFDFFAHLGAWGRILGFGIELGYFGILNSSLGKGQTLGKRIMKLEVVNRQGEHIGVGRSCLRYVILGLPMLLNGASVLSAALSINFELLLGLLIFGVGGAEVYLYIFNRATRQSLHDLAAGTFVVKTAPHGCVEKTLWKPHLLIVSLWLLLCCAGMIFFGSKDYFPELAKLQRAILASGNISQVQVMAGKTWARTSRGTSEKSYLNVNAFCKLRPQDYQKTAEGLARIVIASYPEVRNKDMLNIRVSYGYDIGIASGWKNQSFNFTPASWELLLIEPGTPQDKP